MREHCVLTFGERSFVLRSCSQGLEVVHVDVFVDGRMDCSDSELEELADIFTEVGVCGLSSDATRNEEVRVSLSDPTSVLYSNVTFAKFTGFPSLRKLNTRDLAQIKALCSQSECSKGNGPGALCFREVSGRNKVHFNDGAREHDVVIVAVESNCAERFKAHEKYVKLLAAHGIGPKLFEAACDTTTQYFFTAKLGLCTTLEKFLESGKAGEVTKAQATECMRSLATLNALLGCETDSRSLVFCYRSESYREFLQDALVDVGTGRVYFWRTRHITCFQKQSCEETLPLGCQSSKLHVKKTKADCLRYLWSYLAKVAAELSLIC